MVIPLHSRRQIFQSPSSYLAAGQGARNVRFMVNRMLRKGPRSFRGQQTKRRKKMSSGRGVTLEHDRTPVYRKRRMPRRMRRRWVRQVRKNNYMDQYKLGTRTIMFNSSYTRGNADATLHGTAWFSLYGGHSANAQMDDLQFMSNKENEGNPTFVEGGSVHPSTKYFFRSGILDMTIRNVSSDGDNVNNLADVPLEVDIYEILSGRPWMERDGGTTLTEYPNLKDLYSDALSEINGIGNDTKIDLESRGATPWDNTFALGRWRLKILKKTKYRIGAGNTITYQLRDPRQRTISKQRLQEIAGANVPGWTKHIWIVFKAVPGIPVGNAAGTFQERITVGATRKYTYKIEGETDDRNAIYNR